MATFPLITSVAIQDNHRLVFKGAIVLIGLEVRNSNPWQPATLLQTEAPVMNLFDPLVNTVITDGIMTHVTTGRWIYPYRTKRNDVLGQWTARFTVFTPEGIARLENVGVFVLAEGVIDVFTYMTMRDSDGINWFVWIDAAGQINVTQTLPMTLIRVPDALDIPTADWIKLYNIANDHRYLYILVTGEAYVDFAIPSPSAGETEQDGSPTFTATDGRQYVLTFDVAEQLVAVLV